MTNIRLMEDITHYITCKVTWKKKTSIFKTQGILSVLGLPTGSDIQKICVLKNGIEKNNQKWYLFTSVNFKNLLLLSQTEQIGMVSEKRQTLLTGRGKLSEKEEINQLTFLCFSFFFWKALAPSPSKTNKCVELTV